MSAVIVHVFALLLCGQFFNITAEQNVTALGQIKISEYARKLIEHYKQKDPVGLPIQQIPEPMDAPDAKPKLPSVDKMVMTKMKIHGLSKFRIDYVKIDMSQMEAVVSISIDKVDVYGNYLLSSFFSSSTGPFTIKTKNVTAKAIAKLEVNEHGELEAQEISMDFGFKGIDIKFENLSFMFSFLQNIINTMPGQIFESVKPFMLVQLQTIARTEINKETTKIPIKFPNSITPIDQVIAEARRGLRMKSCDPFKLKDYNHTAGFLSVELSDTWLRGITSFHRVGNVSFEMKSNTLYATIQIGTQKLEGSSSWEVGLLAGVLSQTGTVVFSVAYVRVEVILKQSLDVRQKPVLEDLQIDLGNIQVRFNGAGTLDYLVEAGVNIIPNILRYQIVNALENPVKMRIQEQLNQADVERTVMEAAQKFDNGELDELIKDTSTSNVCPLSKIGL